MATLGYLGITALQMVELLLTARADVGQRRNDPEAPGVKSRQVVSWNDGPKHYHQDSNANVSMDTRLFDRLDLPDSS